MSLTRICQANGPQLYKSYLNEFDKELSSKWSLAAASHISKHVYLLEEFLASEFEKGGISKTLFTNASAKIKIHVHCHQKALSNQKHTFDVLNFPTHYSPTLITSGCCGMAGSFGYEKEHYDVSMKIGALRLFPAVLKAKKNTIIDILAKIKK